MSDKGLIGVRLGGVTRRRSLLGGRRNRVENLALVAAGVVALVVAFAGQTVPWILGAMAGVTVVFFFVSPTTRDVSLAADMVLTRRWRLREAAGLTRFTPGEPVTVPVKGGKVRYPSVSNRRPQVVPDWLGRVRPVVIRSRRGGSVLVLLHYPDSEMRYATITLEVEASTTGVESLEEEMASYERWGRFQAFVASGTSLVRAIQQLERVQTVSLAAHQAWLEERIGQAQPSEELVESYKGVLDEVAWTAEAHHSLITLKIPMNAAFTARCVEEYGDAKPESRAKLAVDEAARVTSEALTQGVYRRMTPLDEESFAKAVRASLDPDYSFDDERDATIHTCWPAYVTEKRQVILGDDWRLRTARITGAGMPAGIVAVNILRDMATGIYPAIVRTVAINTELIPAREARRDALSNKAVDEAARRDLAGKVSDGSEEVQALASTELADDLRPGTGHNAASFTIHITVAGQGEKGLTRAVRRVEGVAGTLGMSLEWMDRAQDLALATTLPLGRGLKPWKRAGLFS